jgi:F0F1-type ATP synthase epsilon subunit
MGVLKNHAPLITGLDVGAMLIRKMENGVHMLLWAVALIKQNQVTILANEAQSSESINQRMLNLLSNCKENLEKAEGKDKVKLTLHTNALKHVFSKSWQKILINFNKIRVRLKCQDAQFY